LAAVTVSVTVAGVLFVLPSLVRKAKESEPW
jgi:hypothetical protein